MNLKDVKPAPLGEIPGSPETFRLKDFRPKNIFNIPVTEINRAKFPVTDMHAHAWMPDTDIDAWVQIMDAVNIEKSTILSFETGTEFDQIFERFSAHPARFNIWCGFDYSGYDSGERDWTERAIAELKRCRQMGASGVGELGDKGLGEYYSSPVPGYGMHIDDSRMDPLLETCAKLNMPINIHIADPIWMYLPMDIHNDGMMNAYNWRIEQSEGKLNHEELLHSFERAVQKHPKTIFIACHFINCSHDLSRVGRMLDNYSNLYVDLTSRLKEICTVPRYAKSFIEKYSDRIFFGSDVGYDPGNTMTYAQTLYKALFRLMESADEHIYEHDLFKYHWPLSGLELSDKTLKKVYHDNSFNLMNR